MFYKLSDFGPTPASDAFYKGSKNPAHYPNGKTEIWWLPDDIWDNLSNYEEASDRWRYYSSNNEAIKALKISMLSLSDKYDIKVKFYMGWGEYIGKDINTVKFMYHGSIRHENLIDILDIELTSKKEKVVDALQIHKDGEVWVNGKLYTLDQVLANKIREIVSIPTVDLPSEPISLEWLEKQGHKRINNYTACEIKCKSSNFFYLSGSKHLHSGYNVYSSTQSPIKLETKGDYFKLMEFLRESDAL